MVHIPQPRKILHNLDEIPAFATEADEAAFWADHDLSQDVLARMGSVPDDVLPPARPRTIPRLVRFDDDTLRRVKALARKRHTGYQSMLRTFVAERLAEEEQRENRTGS